MLIEHVLFLSVIFLLVGFLVIFIYFKWKTNQLKKYFNGQKKIINRLLSLENRKGALLEKAYLQLSEWIASEIFKQFVMTTLLVNSEIEYITKNSQSGIKRLAEALEPNVEILQQNLIKEFKNNFDDVVNSLRKEIEEEMRSESIQEV